MSVEDSCCLVVRTLSGVELCLEDVNAETTLLEVRRLVGEQLCAPPHSLAFLLDGDVLEDCGRTLGELGLACGDGSLLVTMRQLSNQDCQRIFQELCEALRQHRMDEAKRLVDAGAGFDEEGNILKTGGKVGCTMLHLAIREAMPELTVYLIARGVDVESENDSNRRAFSQAVIKKQNSVVAALLDAGADATVIDGCGKTGLDYALQQQNDELCELIVRRCHDDVLKTQLRKFDQLLLIFHGSPVPLDSATTEATQRFASQTFDDALQIRKSIDMSASLADFRGVFRCAVACLPLTAQALLEFSAPVDGTDGRGRSALHYAHAHELPDLVKALIDAGADPAARDRDGRLPSDGVPSRPPTLHMKQAGHACTVS